MHAVFQSLLVLLLFQIGTGTLFDSKKCKYRTNCGVVLDIKPPLRFKGDSEKCGHHKCELTCENNHTVLQLGFSKFFVEAINYGKRGVQFEVTYPGLQKDNCSSLPKYPVIYDDLFPYEISDTSSSTILILTCKSPGKSPHYVDTAPCITAKDFSYSLGYSRTEHDFYSYALIGDSLVASDIEDSCTIHKFMITRPLFHSNSSNISFADIHKHMASGIDLFLTDYRVPDFRIDIGPVILFGTLMGVGLIFGTIVVGLLFGALIGAVFLLAGNLTSFGSLFSNLMGAGLLFVSCRGGVGIIILIGFLIYKCKRRHLSEYENIEAFLSSPNNFLPIRYSYKEIKKMTNNFKEKLGKGGYGEVYKGKSRSGHFVAVKMLNEAKGNGQDFINEVAAIGRIYHLNVVRLIGFCVTASKRALVYDYMPNGSLDKFIFSEDADGTPLSWEKAFEIAVGVARGIAYLHQGCEMQIFHFDIKPHNILLDDNFVPKVADFGLAKLCPRQKSAITLTAAKGTLGYMAPELIYRKLGEVSSKADVYSFGQLVFAMVRMRKVIAVTDHSSRVYFSSWIYDTIDRGEEQELDLGAVTKEEKDIVRKLILVALWCVQWTPTDRPSMREVLEMLGSDLEGLRLPAKPLYYALDPPPREQSSNQNSGDSTFPLCESIALEIEHSDE